MSSEGNSKEAIKDMFKEAFEHPYEKTEDEENNGFEQKKCPLNKCDGSGYNMVMINGYRKAKDCECYKEEQMKRRLRMSNMDDAYFDKTLKLHGLVGTLLHPLAKPPKRELAKGKNNQVLKVQPEEEPNEYIARVYKQIEMKNGLEAFVKQYTSRTLEYINESPKQKVKNLILMGDTGRGKTLTANMIGKEYLNKGKTVYFTTMRALIKDVIDKGKEIEKMIANVELLLIDELGYEYHTESGWAITNIKELLRVRYNRKLPVVCTTNLLPDVLAEMYDASIMSLFHGTYFMVFVDREDGDYRIQEADASLSDFDELKV